MVTVPVVATALHGRLQVAAIDFGTTYSGYAFSFRSDFLEDPLKIITNNWKTGANAVSLKCPSCILFDPNRKFHSFGFEAEDTYVRLAEDEDHYKWFYFNRFKMILYENKVHVMITFVLFFMDVPFVIELVRNQYAFIYSIKSACTRISHTNVHMQ